MEMCIQRPRAHWMIRNSNGKSLKMVAAMDSATKNSMRVCLNRAVLIGPWNVVTESCDGSGQQKWSIETATKGLDAAWPIRLHNKADDFCIYTDYTGWVYGTIVNCGLADGKQPQSGLCWGAISDGATILARPLD